MDFLNCFGQIVDQVTQRLHHLKNLLYYYFILWLVSDSSADCIIQYSRSSNITAPFGITASTDCATSVSIRFVLADLNQIHTSLVGMMSEKILQIGFGFIKHIGLNRHPDGNHASVLQTWPSEGTWGLEEHWTSTHWLTMTHQHSLCVHAAVTYFTQSLIWYMKNG